MTFIGIDGLSKKYLLIKGTTDRQFAADSWEDYYAWFSLYRGDNLDCPNLLSIENGIATVNPQKIGFMLSGAGEQKILKVDVGMMTPLTQEQLDNIEAELLKLN